MDFWTYLGNAVLALLSIYAVSVPLVMAWSVVERRRDRKERQDKRRKTRWMEV